MQSPCAVSAPVVRTGTRDSRIALEAGCLYSFCKDFDVDWPHPMGKVDQNGGMSGKVSPPQSPVPLLVHLDVRKAPNAFVNFVHGDIAVERKDQCYGDLRNLPGGKLDEDPRPFCTHDARRRKLGFKRLELRFEHGRGRYGRGGKRSEHSVMACLLAWTGRGLLMERRRVYFSRERG